MTTKLALRDLMSIALAGVGALLLFMSFVFDWVGTKAVLTANEESDLRVSTGHGSQLGIDGFAVWGTVYVLGAMLLVALFVGVMTLPLTVGRGIRVIGVGWAVGLGAIVASIAVRATDLFQSTLLADDGSPLMRADRVSDLHWQPGFGCAVGALVLLIGAFGMARAPLLELDETSRRAAPQEVEATPVPVE